MIGGIIARVAQMKILSVLSSAEEPQKATKDEELDYRLKRCAAMIVGIALIVVAIISFVRKIG